MFFGGDWLDKMVDIEGARYNLHNSGTLHPGDIGMQQRIKGSTRGQSRRAKRPHGRGGKRGGHGSSGKDSKEGSQTLVDEVANRSKKLVSRRARSRRRSSNVSEKRHGVEVSRSCH